MLRPAAIVVLSASYSGIFEETGLLSDVKKSVHIIAGRLSPFGAYILASVFTAMISCNQTLAVMLTHQLYGDAAETGDEAALALENSAVIISPLIPWCIAGAVPLAAIGAPSSSVLYAGYLMFVPAFYCIARLRKQGAAVTGEKKAAAGISPGGNGAERTEGRKHGGMQRGKGG
jgi:NhaC family Na+:H+ antiporter